MPEDDEGGVKVMGPITRAALDVVGLLDCVPVLRTGE